MARPSHDGAPPHRSSCAGERARPDLAGGGSEEHGRGGPEAAARVPGEEHREEGEEHGTEEEEDHGSDLETARGKIVISVPGSHLSDRWNC